MAYSFIAITSVKPDWKDLHSNIFRANSAIEMFPIKSDDPKTYYLGMCIPFHKLDLYPNTWNDLVELINKLKTVYNFKVFDLYNGFFINDKNIKIIKKSLTS